MRSRHEILCYFGLFVYKFGCHGNSLGSLDILDSMFEFADPENRVWVRHSEGPLFRRSGTIAQIYRATYRLKAILKSGCHIHNGTYLTLSLTLTITLTLLTITVTVRVTLRNGGPSEWRTVTENRTMRA